MLGNRVACRRGIAEGSVVLVIYADSGAAASCSRKRVAKTVLFWARLVTGHFHLGRVEAARTAH